MVGMTYLRLLMMVLGNWIVDVRYEWDATHISMSLYVGSCANRSDGCFYLSKEVVSNKSQCSASG